MAKTFGTVCDGIGCGHLAFNRAGFECAWSAEIEPFPCAVLDVRFPGVRNHGDMTMTAEYVRDGAIVAPDVFIGGTPCQAFSVAGKRKGLEDARGNLSLTFCGIADAIDDVRRRDGKPPCVVLWENVPGVLSDAGNAFGCFLGELAGSGCQLQPAGDGWGNAGCVFGPRRTVAWRVLDSQFFGVAQRRRRVFVVASAGDGCRPEEILFEREGVRRDSPPCRESRQGVAKTLTRGVGQRYDSETEDFVMASTYDMRGRGKGDTVNTLCTDHASRPSDYCPVVAIQDVRGVDKAQNGRGYNADGTAYTVDAMATQGVAVAFAQNQIGEVRAGDIANTLNTNANASGRNTAMVAIASREVAQTITSNYGKQCDNSDTALGPNVAFTTSSVRRLTPIECERLQGLPDDWTLIPWRGKSASDCPDGPRYKGIGNGQTVNVMEWLARRIMERMP